MRLGAFACTPVASSVESATQPAARASWYAIRRSPVISVPWAERTIRFFSVTGPTCSGVNRCSNFDTAALPLTVDQLQ